MAVIQTTNLPQPTYTTQKPKPNYNWAAVQLNLIMLPVGLAVLFIVSLAAVLCHCLRKRRLRRIAKRYKQQQRSSIVYSVHSNGVPKFSHSPVKLSPPASLIEEPNAPIHPALVRKKKKNHQMHQSQEISKNHTYSEKRRTSRRSITPVDERPHSKEKYRNGKVPIEHRRSRIPIPARTAKKARRNSSFETERLSSVEHKRSSSVEHKRPSSVEHKRSSSVENRRSHTVRDSSSFVNNIAVIDRDDPYRIDMNTVRSSKDRRKWEIPATKSIEYDPERGIRLPPLLEKGMVKTSQ